MKNKVKKIIKYLRKIIPHNSPIRLWYTRTLQVWAYISKPVNISGIKLIGVTGTDGKTTTVEMVAHMLETSGTKYISSSSLDTKMNGKKLAGSKRTTPSLSTLKSLLKTAVENNIEVVVLEISSHSLVQWRALGLRFDVAVLTNLTHEHLNFHKTLERYAAAKKLLFTKHLKKDGITILNKDDAYGNKWLSELSGTTIPYSQPEASTSTAGVHFIHDNEDYAMPMLGTYNASNALAAALALDSLQIVTTEVALGSVANFNGILGRMQVIDTSDKHSASIIVDFALTKKAMASVLSTARELASEDGKVFVVFGATGGQHDTSVRPGLAMSVSNLADVAIVTDDEPYDGNPDDIRSELVKLIQKSDAKSNNTTTIHNIADRRTAIQKVLAEAKQGDVVIVSGMGHYTSRTVNGEEEPWNDAAVITEELGKL